MSVNVNLEIDGNTENLGTVEAVEINKLYGPTRLKMVVNFIDLDAEPAPQARTMARTGGTGLSGIVKTVSPILQSKAADLRATAQASAEQARVKAEADEAAANPVRGREA